MRVSADDLGDAFEQAADVIHHHLQHPRTGEKQHDEHPDQLRDERQGLLVDLRRGLKDADDQADDQNGQKQRPGEYQGHLDGLPADAHDDLRRHVAKLMTSEPSRRCQPSTRTKSISLKGMEIITGDIIIMPIDISTLATTMSIIRKGMKMMKPIWKAVFSSLVTKAGISTRIGTSLADSSFGTLAKRANRPISASRVCLSMKP